MNKLPTKEHVLLNQGNAPFIDFQEIYKFENLSLPKQDMIMPQEFNTISNPIHSDFTTQSTVFHNGL